MNMYQTDHTTSPTSQPMDVAVNTSEPHMSQTAWASQLQREIRQQQQQMRVMQDQILNMKEQIRMLQQQLMRIKDSQKASFRYE